MHELQIDMDTDAEQQSTNQPLYLLYLNLAKKLLVFLKSTNEILPCEI